MRKTLRALIAIAVIAAVLAVGLQDLAAAPNAKVWKTKPESIHTQDKVDKKPKGNKGDQPAEVIKVKGVRLNKQIVAIPVEGEDILIATIDPETATDKSVSWSSSDPNVATVDNTGKVKGKAPGTATITVTTTDGGFTDSAVITISAAASSGGLSVFSGANVTFVLEEDGTLWGAGWNLYGQLGVGDNSNRGTPVRVEGVADIVSVSNNANHTVALDGSGQVWTWGDGTYGALGDGTTSSRNVPVQVPGLTGVKAVAAGGRFSTALKEDGTVWVFGENARGQCATGSATPDKCLTPVQVPGLTGVEFIDACNDYAIAVKSDGTVWYWGKFGFITNYTPTQVQDLSGIKAVAAGSLHALALDESGYVWAFGSNNYGQLGNDTLTASDTPIKIASLSGITQISAGAHTSGAVDGAGNALVWGNNFYGQVGDGTSQNNKRTPVMVPGIADVTGVDVGNQTIIVTASGSIYSIGYNYYGQLGDGTSTNKISPVAAYQTLSGQ